MRYLHMCVPTELIILSWAQKIGIIMIQEGDKHYGASHLTLGVQQILMTASSEYECIKTYQQLLNSEVWLG